MGRMNGIDGIADDALVIQIHEKDNPNFELLNYKDVKKGIRNYGLKRILQRWLIL